jgi:hypothetical protein
LHRLIALEQRQRSNKVLDGLTVCPWRGHGARIYDRLPGIQTGTT